MIRPLVLSIVLAALVGCGGSQNAQSLCQIEQPPPSGCGMSCNPSAASSCPSGFFCNALGECDTQCTPGGNQCPSGDVCSADGQCSASGACTGIGCDVVNCAAMNKPATTLSGTVYAPNGTLPLYGVQVYVPTAAVGPVPACAQCDQTLPGTPVSAPAVTDENGKFSLSSVPSGVPVPVVIATGKWRRILMLPAINACADNPLTALDTTLPKSIDDMTPNTTSVDMPKIAISTGSADALECLVRKLGIADKEISSDAGTGHVNLFADTMAGGGEGANKFMTGFAGGTGNFSDSQSLWGNLTKLEGYDIVINSCEGGQHPETKSQTEMNNMKMYADQGGRVFLSHWHNIWVAGSTQGGGNQAPMVWPVIATWNYGNDPGNGTVDTIDETNNPKGPSFATWMLNVMGSTVRDEIAIENNTAKQTCQMVDTTKGERWVYLSAGQTEYTQNFQFTTPNEMPVANRCGKVVFSDMHVSGDSKSSPGGTGYPSQCSSLGLTPQEKAIAFMFFDIASCVSGTIL
jgi:hypothetical protein